MLGGLRAVTARSAGREGAEQGRCVRVMSSSYMKAVQTGAASSPSSSLLADLTTRGYRFVTLTELAG